MAAGESRERPQHVGLRPGLPGLSGVAGAGPAPPPRELLGPRVVAATLSDPELAELALSGRRDAWEVLIGRHNHRVVVALLGRGVALERAKELAQDTWTRLIEQQRRGALRALVLPGLAITQATFLALEDARRRSHKPALDLQEAAERVADPAADVEGRLLSREQLQRAEAALCGCSGSAQRVFRLLYENPQLSHAEAAKEVGLSLQRVRQILCEVRKKLRAAIYEPEEAAQQGGRRP